MRYKSLLPSVTMLSVLLFSNPVTVFAHGEDYWNDFIIDNKNDLVETTMAQVMKVLGDVARGRRQISSWPDAGVRNLRINLIAMQEESEDMLDHLREEDGISLDLPSALRDHPQSGRAVAGAHALEISIELLDYISAMEGPEPFIEELETDGPSVYMIDLIDAYTDTMGVYKTLQQSGKQLVAVRAEFENRTATEDFRFHLGRFLLWAAMDGLAARLGYSPTQQQSENVEVSEPSGAPIP